MIHILNSFTDPRIGGPQLRSLRAARKLSDRGITVEFLIPAGSKDFKEMAESEGFTVHQLRYPSIHPPRKILKNLQYLSSFPIQCGKIGRLLDSGEFDIVHANSPVNFTSAFASALSDAKLVWHFNDTSMPKYLAMPAAALAKRVADQIVVAAREVDRYYFDGDADTKTLYAPVDVDEFDLESYTYTKKDFCERHGLDPELPLIGTVGNVNPVKGHRFLIRSTEEIVKQIGPVNVVIVGGILETHRQYYDDLKELTEEFGLEDNVHFLGRRDDIPELLSAFDVFALPSVSEAFPMVVLEAMAMELPIVATEGGGVPEQITDRESGLLVPPKDPQAMADALVELIEDRNFGSNLGCRARERAVSEFSLERCVDRHEELYRSLSE